MNKLRKGWEIKSLGEIATISSGGTPSRNNMEYWKNGKIPWIRTTEVQNCILNEEDVQEFITEKGLKNSSAKLVPAGTILLAMIGQGKTRGQVAYLTFEASTNQNCATISFRKEYDSKFYFQYLLSKYESIRGMSNSAGQSNLSGALVKSIKVPVPPLPEQIKIAEILSTWDNAIQTTEKQITNSQQQKKALMQMLLSGEKRVGGFSGEWGTVTLSQIANIKKGEALSSKDIIDGVYPVIAGGKTSPYNHNAYTDENVVTVSASGAYAGFVSYHPYKIWASDCSVISAKKCSDILFIFQILFYFQEKIYSLQSGGAQPHIYPKDLDSLKLEIPQEIDEQQKIAKILTTADQEIETLQRKLECLKLEKRALMQKLL